MTKTDSDSASLGSNPSSPASENPNKYGTSEEIRENVCSPLVPTNAPSATRETHKSRHRAVHICSYTTRSE
jgi:hypothetical protein